MIQTGKPAAMMAARQTSGATRRVLWPASTQRVVFFGNILLFGKRLPFSKFPVCDLPACALLHAICVIMACATMDAALAQSVVQLAQAPLPPRRPAHLDTARPDTARPNTARPAIPAQSPLPVPPAPKADAAAPPYHPITAPGPMSQRRPALRNCFEEWQKMKRTGTTGTRVWRDFSEECLTR